MRKGYFPTFSSSARKGESGSNFVAQIVNDRFGWIFKRNHQEHDFGIDGQLEVVTSSANLTGQLVAVQIKYGSSYFAKKNRLGYVYRGENRHLNYLSNYPIPVLLIICNPDTHECFWVKFDPTQTTGTTRGWTITIPFENKFRESKSQILALLPEAQNYQQALERFWALNKLLKESDYKLFVFDSEDIDTNSTSRVRGFFDRLRASRELAYACKGTVEFSFSGYDSDPRELFEIQEVCAYVRLLSNALPELLFFVRTTPSAHTLRLFALCIGGGHIVGQRATGGTKHRVEFDTKLVAAFLMEKWPGLNEMTGWLGMSIDDNKVMTYDVLHCLGVDPPKE